MFGIAKITASVIYSSYGSKINILFHVWKILVSSYAKSMSGKKFSSVANVKKKVTASNAVHVSNGYVFSIFFKGVSLKFSVFISSNRIFYFL